MFQKMDKARIEHLKEVIQEDIEGNKYFGAVISVAQQGEIALQEAFGYADEKHTRVLAENSIFSLFSLTKAFTNAMVFRAIELGQFALTTRISEIIPEFSGGQRQHINIYHLLTHTSGLPASWIPKPGMYLDKFDDIINAICENTHSTEAPGNHVFYSPLFNHALLGEALLRCDPQKRSYRDIMQDELFGPLNMHDTSIGVRADLKDRHILPDFRGRPPMEHLGSSNLGSQGAFQEEHAEMPWLGAISTMPDIYRFTEMLRQGGELDGNRILSPAILDLATQNWTGNKPNELYKTVAINHGWAPYPAYLGLGFSLRGEMICPSLFGTLSSPGTFGNYGSGSTLFWIDPERDLSFVFVSAGVMQQAQNIERFQRLSDIALSAVE
jgi:CubicO group peptidase (beta-lactamase class C family)